MSRIFDNIDHHLLSALRATMQMSQRSDFCVGYLNLRGWHAIDDLITPWDSAAGQVCRVLVGMQRPPQEEIRELYRQADDSGLIDNATASRLKLQFASHLREQITLGIPTGICPNWQQFGLPSKSPCALGNSENWLLSESLGTP